MKSTMKMPPPPIGSRYCRAMSPGRQTVTATRKPAISSVPLRVPTTSASNARTPTAPARAMARTGDL